jgi:hypothetical protein
VDERIAVTEAEVLSLLASALTGNRSGPDDAFTANELEEMLGGRVHRKRLLDVLAALWKAGKVETVTVYRQHPTRLARVPAYRFRAAES